MYFIHGELVNSVNRVQKNDNTLFNKLIADVRKQLTKHRSWQYVPTKEHLDAIIAQVEFDIEYIEHSTYFQIRRK